MRPLATREWIVIGTGGAVVPAVLLWAFVIVPGMEKLDSDRLKVATYRRMLTVAQEKVRHRVELDADYARLQSDYSNQIAKISDVRVPADIADVLRIEFENIDRRYGSAIGRTQIPPLNTNKVYYNELKYRLSDVQCDWESLHMALYFIENAGQLVGFDSLTLTAVPEAGKMKSKADMSVISCIFPKRGTREWRRPDYDKMEKQLRGERDIFQLPPELMPKAAPSAPTEVISDEKQPGWTRSILQTGIIIDRNSNTQACFNNKSAQKTQIVMVGDTVSNTSAIVKEIEVVAERVTLVENGQEFHITLRDYRKNMYAEPKPFSFDVGRPGAGEKKRSDVPGGAAATPGKPGELALDHVEVPAEYEQKLGSFADCQMKLGAFLLPVDEFVQRRYALQVSQGMLVVRINKVGSALKSGIARGDVIVGIGGRKVDTRESFTYLLNDAAKQSPTISIQVNRNAQVQTITAEMGK